MSPKISIVIPIYNSASHLQHCLDSVANQTFTDIQVICVDRSSTDGSRNILEEYAAKDPRFQIVECEDTPGGGPGQTRNAGFPYVCGKYTYFVDSDDWIDPTLCEKAYYRLEQTQCDLVLFFRSEVCEPAMQHRLQNPLEDYQWSFASSEPSRYFGFQVMPWLRMIRTSFLQKINFRFPEAMISEDTFFHWVLLAHEPKTELIPETLYHHYLRSASITGQRGEYVARLSYVFGLIKEYYLLHDKYEKFREPFLCGKMNAFVWSHKTVKKPYRELAIRCFTETLDDDELQFLRESPLINSKVRKKILALIGRKTFRSRLCEMIRVCFNTAYRPIKMLSRKLLAILMRKQIVMFQNRIQELNGQIAARDKKIVVMQTQDNIPER